MMDAQVDRLLDRLRAQSVQLVCIGASAGAIEVLSHLLPAISSQTDMSFTIVVHLPSDRESLLASIFHNRCALPVEEAYDKLPVRPAHVYFAPPAYHLLVERSLEFSLSIDSPVHFSRPSIDVLFESVADAVGPGALGLVLTGGNQDGAHGLKAIYDQGGLAVVQRPCQAQVPMMPESALARCPAAFSLSVSELVELFQKL